MSLHEKFSSKSLNWTSSAGKKLCSKQNLNMKSWQTVFYCGAEQYVLPPSVYWLNELGGDLASAPAHLKKIATNGRVRYLVRFLQRKKNLKHDLYNQTCQRLDVLLLGGQGDPWALLGHIDNAGYMAHLGILFMIKAPLRKLKTYLVCHIAWYSGVETSSGMKQVSVKIMRVSPVNIVIIAVIHKLHVHELTALCNVHDLNIELSIFWFQRRCGLIMSL